MSHANDVEREEAKKKLIEDWKTANGISDEDISKGKAKDSSPWSETLKKLIVQPSVWIFLSVLTVSPYGVDIVKAILNFFATK